MIVLAKIRHAYECIEATSLRDELCKEHMGDVGRIVIRMCGDLHVLSADGFAKMAGIDFEARHRRTEAPPVDGATEFEETEEPTEETALQGADDDAKDDVP